MIYKGNNLYWQWEDLKKGDLILLREKPGYLILDAEAPNERRMKVRFWDFSTNKVESCDEYSVGELSSEFLIVRDGEPVYKGWRYGK